MNHEPEERMILTHEPVAPYPKATLAAFALAVAYLVVIFVLSAGGGAH